jgi:hypothetical protein
MKISRPDLSKIVGFLAIFGLVSTGSPLNVRAQSTGSLVLKAGSTSSNTFYGYNLIALPSNTPNFNGAGVLQYVGGNYPGLSASPAVTQPTVTKTVAVDGAGFTQSLNTAGYTANYRSQYGTGASKTTVSSTLAYGGAQANNAGISFNAGTGVSSPSSSPAGTAIVSVTSATAILQVTGGTIDSLTPGAYLDVAGNVTGGTGALNFVAFGLSGSYQVETPKLNLDGTTSYTLLTSQSYQLFGAYSGGILPSILPINGAINTTSPPAGFNFEATGGFLFNAISGLTDGTRITLKSTLTMLADPDASVELIYAPPVNSEFVPDLGGFAGGPVQGFESISTPEPSTLMSLIAVLPIFYGIVRHSRRRKV